MVRLRLRRVCGTAVCAIAMVGVAAPQPARGAPSPRPSWTVMGGQTNAQLGRSVASAGDVNRDGFDDVVLGAPNYDNGQGDEGVALLYLGSALGLAAAPDLVLEQNQGNASFGASVASAGDVNGDGYDDVVVGAPGYEQGLLVDLEGWAFLYLGSANGLSATPAWSVRSGLRGAEFGHSVASAGDVNGDGHDDVAVSAFNYGNGEVEEGAVFLFLGTATGLSATPSWTVEGAEDAAHFGSALASADVNGDGYGDLVVGAPYLYDGGYLPGQARVYLGSAAGLSATPSWTATSDQLGEILGFAVSSGDVNNDGYDDVAVGVTGYGNGSGAVVLYLGSSTGLAASPAWGAAGFNNASFGQAVTAGADVNGDGHKDLVAGGPNHGVGGQLFEGVAALYLGRPAGLTPAPLLTAEGNQPIGYFGQVVASAGDVNGDGRDDVLVASDLYEGAFGDEGAAFLYLGQ